MSLLPRSSEEEAAAEVPRPRSPSRRPTGAPEDEEDEELVEAHEGESVAERPDSPDDLDEAAGETSEPRTPADS